MSEFNLLITDREKIRKAWGKTYSDIVKDIEIIKEWLKLQKHLPETPTDNMIEFVLTNCKFSIEKTKQNLDMYYTIRGLMPDMYKGIHPCRPTDIEPAYKTGIICPLPQLTPDLCRVTIFKYNDIEPEESCVGKYSSHGMINLYEVRMHEDLVMGEVIVVDYEYIKFGIMARISPILIKNCAQIIEKVQSNRMKALHLLYPPAYVDKVIRIFKNFLVKKLQDRMFVHHSLEDLYKHIPREILPREYGGKEKSLKELEELWRGKFNDYKSRFDKLEGMQVNEDLRPEKLENDEILGYHGNFKKISLD